MVTGSLLPASAGKTQGAGVPGFFDFWATRTGAEKLTGDTTGLLKRLYSNNEENFAEKLLLVKHLGFGVGLRDRCCCSCGRLLLAPGSTGLFDLLPEGRALAVPVAGFTAERAVTGSRAFRDIREELLR